MERSNQVAEDKSLDDELSEVLLSISKVTQRLAKKISIIGKTNQKGENKNGKNEQSHKFNRRS